MKTFVNWLWENKLIAMSGDDALRTRMIKPFPVRLIQYTPDQILTDEKIGAMIDAAWTLRDKVWIVLMFGCGARPKEMASLRWRDLGFESENEEDYATLYTAVHEGKIMKDGSDVKDSWLYEGLDYVFRLREEQMTKYHDTPDSYVFRCFNRSERRLTDKPMTRSAIDCALRNIGKRAGINFKKGSLQRAFRVGGITNDYRKGMDIVAIAQKHFAAGENTRVLIHYLRATKDDKKKAQIPARLRKKKKTETTAPAEGITCIRCGTKHMAGVTFCDKCHRPLTPSTMTEKADLRRQFEAFEAFKREQMANEAARKGIGEKILKS
jgi:integrase